MDRTSKLIAIIDNDEATQDSLGDPIEAAGLVARCLESADFALVCPPGRCIEGTAIGVRESGCGSTNLGPLWTSPPAIRQELSVRDGATSERSI